MTPAPAGSSSRSSSTPDPIAILRQLVRFDTTNPPGNERACVEYIQSLFDEAGIPTTMVAKDAQRPTLVARLKGEGHAPPLLLYGHVDVVSTRGQDWKHDPFAAELIDGVIWGRGTLDMKSGLAMYIAAMLRAKQQDTALPGDVIFAAFPDEEAGGDYGAGFVVDEHPELLHDAPYAIGEIGGFPVTLGSSRFYAIQVAEKHGCRTLLRMRGPGGHASMPVYDGAMAQLGKVLERLQDRLPVHITPPAKAMIQALVDATDGPMSEQLSALLDPQRVDDVLPAFGPYAKLFDAVLHNTVSPTIVRGSDKINVIPGTVELECDVRLLPGFTDKDFVPELKQHLDMPGVEIEVLRYSDGPPAGDMGLFDTLASILAAGPDPAPSVPWVVTGGTDARHLARLGIESYGFMPLNLPASMDANSLLHNANERVPAAAVEFGTSTVFKLLQCFG